MSSITEIDDVLNDTAPAAPSLKFAEIGTTHEGTLISSQVRMVKKYKSSEIDCYEDGRPKRQLHLILNINGEEHSLWAKGQMLTALREALEENKLEAGGTIKVRYEREEPTSDGKYMRKVYLVKWTPPAAPIAQADDPAFGDEPF